MDEEGWGLAKQSTNRQHVGSSEMFRANQC